MRRPRWTWGGGSLDRLQEGANPLDRRRTRLSAPAQVKYETRIADCVAPETRWSSLASIQKLLNFTQ